MLLLIIYDPFYVLLFDQAKGMVESDGIRQNLLDEVTGDDSNYMPPMGGLFFFVSVGFLLPCKGYFVP